MGAAGGREARHPGEPPELRRLHRFVAGAGLPRRGRIADRLGVLRPLRPHGRAPGRRPNQNLKSAQSPHPGGRESAQAPAAQVRPGRKGALMTSGHAWVLLLAWLPALWVAREWRESARRAALVLKAPGLAAVLIALAEPRVTVHETKVAAAILIDTSARL